jgi:hypothetical protein
MDYMVTATFELPSSMFQVKWGSYTNPDDDNIDRFRLYERKWHWHRSHTSNLNEVEMGASESLRGIAKIFAEQNEDGEALDADFFCAPRIETVIDEGMEDSLEIFPIDAIFEEIENVFSKIEYAYLEYGAGREWMVVRFSDWAPSYFLDGTQNMAHHLFWFDAKGIDFKPEMVYINHEMPDDLAAGDNWKSWELLLRSSGKLILCTAPREKGALCHTIDLTVEPGPNVMNPIEFLSSCAQSLTVVPAPGLEDNQAGLEDSWGYVVFGQNADIDSLGFEFNPE